MHARRTVAHRDPTPRPRLNELFDELLEDDGGYDLERALRLGGVSDDGCLTADGRRFSLRIQ